MMVSHQYLQFRTQILRNTPLSPGVKKFVVIAANHMAYRIRYIAIASPSLLPISFIPGYQYRITAVIDSGKK